jgi:carboxypeptidase Taq
MKNFSELLAHYQKISRLDGILQTLWWDMETFMPVGAGEERSEQIGVLSGQIQELWSDENFFENWSECFEESRNEKFASDQKAQVQKLGLELAKRRAITVDFASREARLQSSCQNAWKQARSGNNFAGVLEPLTELVRLNREKASRFQEAALLKERYRGKDLYTVLFDQLEPGFDGEVLKKLFSELEAGLSQKLPAIVEKHGHSGEAIPMPLAQQRALYAGLPVKLGMDGTWSRLDESTHPFCGGARGDVRITTRYFENDFSDSMFSVIHETGHGLYEQGIPKKWWHTPIGQAASFGVHESQSRFLENQIGRSDAFCRWLAQQSGLDFARIKASVRRVRPGYIRVAADEVTYNFHIILRWKIERGLMDGSLEVKDLPEFWNHRFLETMKLKVEKDSQGCLQDIHWFGGAFGYFPTYTLGNLLAAELYQDFQREVPDWRQKIEAGDFTIVREFMRPRIYDQAARHDSPETMKRALHGRELGVKAFFDYVDERYLT